MRRFLPIIVLLTLSACERGNEEPTIYDPGEYAQKLDARGRRHVISGADGEPVAKIRVRSDELRVYARDMTLLGSVSRNKDQVVVNRAATTEASFTSPTSGVTELPGRFRLETVERGWAVFDPEARRLGYFEWLDDGRLALRDDYSSAPRVFGRVDGADARTPSGEVRVSALPPYSAAAVLPFALEGDLDELDKVALGAWLVSQKPATKAPNP